MFHGRGREAREVRSLLQGYYSTAKWGGWDFAVGLLFFKAEHLNLLLKQGFSQGNLRDSCEQVSAEVSRKWNVHLLPISKATCEHTGCHLFIIATLSPA